MSRQHEHFCQWGEANDSPLCQCQDGCCTSPSGACICKGCPCGDVVA